MIDPQGTHNFLHLHRMMVLYSIVGSYIISHLLFVLAVVQSLFYQPSKLLSLVYLILIRYGVDLSTSDASNAFNCVDEILFFLVV